MTAFFEYQIRGGVILALAVIIYHLFLSNDHFFYRNRVWLLSCLFIPWIVPLLAMPLWVKLLVFGEEREVVSTAVPIVIQQIDQALLVDAASKNAVAWEQVGLLVYAIISVVLLLRLLWGYRHVLQLRRQDASFRYKGCKVVVLKDEHSNPFSFFRTIFIPKYLDRRGDKHLVMEHERTHCRQWHSVDLSLAEWLIVIHWWNPFAWWLRKLITYNHEYCVDQAMMRITPEPKQYQYSLLDLLPGSKRMQLVNNFNQSITKKRIVMMNQSDRNQVATWMKGILIASITVIALLAFTNPDTTAKAEEKQDQLEAIKTEKDLRHYLARYVKYPIDAVYNNIQGEVVAHFSVDENGRAGRPVIGEAAGDNTFKVDEVIVTAHSRRPTQEPSSKEVVVLSDDDVALEVNEKSKETGLSLLEKEVERLLTDLPMFADPSLQGRTIEMRLTFVLQAGKGEENSSLLVKATENALYIIDGKTASKEEVEALPVEQINSLSVLKNEAAIDKYGEKGKNGVVEIQLLKGTATVNSSDSIRIGPMVAGRQPLYVVDGEEVPDLSGVDKNNVESVTVLKEESATTLYGDRAKDGVIIITLKKKEQRKTSGEIIIESADTLCYNKSQDAVKLFGDVRIRGLSGENSPLFIINGEAASQNQNLDDLDSDAIESVSIIKGEQAIARYGEQAKNGVVLIELKQSK
jgi:beta-lactamase regulating signal transducer with metallopeptidase domain